MDSSFRARCSDQQLLLRRLVFNTSALRPGIEPDLRASKAHVATTRRRMRGGVWEMGRMGDLRLESLIFRSP